MNIQSPSPIPNSTQVSDTLFDRDTYLSNLLALFVETRSNIDWWQELRDRAANWVRHSTLPTKKDEEWRITDLSGLKQVDFHNNVETRYIASPYIASLQNRLVFVNGIYAPQHSAIALPNIIVGNLAGIAATDTEKLQPYLAQAEGNLEVFTALNTAGMTDAAVIYVPKNVVVSEPIHVVFITVGENIISQPRCLVVAESGSKVTLVEEFWQDTPVEPVYLTNSVTEVWVEENAEVNHTRVERESLAAFHIGKTAVTQARDSRYTCNAVTFGGQLSRHNLEILQNGAQTETTLNGLTMISGDQLADTHSAIALNHPHSTTNQLQKNVVADKAHAVFNGKVFVPKPAQLTDAAQLNRNLLLSPKARVDTKPQLEITADNVKCAHGATVSQLEDDEIFYLQSRGINENSARHLLVNAFAAEIIAQIPVSSVRDQLTKQVTTYI